MHITGKNTKDNEERRRYKATHFGDGEVSDDNCEPSISFVIMYVTDPQKDEI